MKTNVQLCSYLAQFLEREIFQTKVVERIKTHILRSILLFFRKFYHLWENVGNCCRGGQAPDDNACLIPKATNTHSDL